jgi:hypothetical protein
LRGLNPGGIKITTSSGEIFVGRHWQYSEQIYVGESQQAGRYESHQKRRPHMAEHHHHPEDNSVNVKVAIFFIAVLVVIALIGVLN